MPVLSTDIQFLLSGGAANTSPAASLGGIASTTQVVDAVDNNLFADVTPAQATAGAVHHRGLYAKNVHASLALTDARLFISSLTSSADDELDVAIAVEAVNVDMATIASETTVPTGVTFTRPTTYGTGLQFNAATGLVASARRGDWGRRTVNAGAAAATAVTGTIRVEGTTT